MSDLPFSWSQLASELCFLFLHSYLHSSVARPGFFAFISLFPNSIPVFQHLSCLSSSQNCFFSPWHLLLPDILPSDPLFIHASNNLVFFLLPPSFHTIRDLFYILHSYLPFCLFSFTVSSFLSWDFILHLCLLCLNVHSAFFAYLLPSTPDLLFFKFPFYFSTFFPSLRPAFHLAFLLYLLEITSLPPFLHCLDNPFFPVF